MKVVILII